MKAWRVILVAFLVGVGVTIWWGLNALEPRARWLKVDAPRAGRVGKPFPIRVHLEPINEASFLTADLHWGKSHDRSELYLSTGGSRKVDPSGGTYEFVLPVPPRPALRYVQVVLYLSPDGNWNTRTRAANSDFMEVTTNANEATDAQLIPLQMTEGTSSSIPPPAAKWPHLLTGSIFVLAAALAWWRDRSNFGFGMKAAREAVRWRIPASTLILAAIWELTAMQARIDGLLREYAHQQDIYYLRGAVQKLAISLVLTAAVWLLWQTRKVPAGQRFFFAVFSLYVTLAAVDLISIHAIDQVLERSWQGITLSQAIGMVCAILLLRWFLSNRAPNIPRN